VAGPGPRRWNPDAIVEDYLLRDEVVKLDASRSFKSWVVDQTVWILLAMTAFVVLATIGSDASIGLGVLAVLALGAYLLFD